MARPRLIQPDIGDIDGQTGAATIDGEFDDVTKLAGDIDAQIKSVTSEFDADDSDVILKLKVHRVLPLKGKRSWLFDLMPSELPIMDKLRDVYGTGSYEVTVFKNGTLYRKFPVEVEAPPKPVVNAGTQNVNELVTVLVNNQREQFNQLKELMMLQRPSASVAVSPAFNMQETMAGMLTMMVQMKSFLAPAQQTGGIDMLLKGVELAKEIGGSGGETNFLDVIRDVVKSDVFGKALEASVANPLLPTTQPANPTQPTKRRIPVQVSQNANANANANVNMNVNANSEVNPMRIPNIVIKQYLGQLISRADRGSDPALYAEFVLDNVAGTPFEKPLIEFLSRENVVDELTKIDGRVAPHALWFQELRDNLVSILTDEETSDDTDSDASEPAAAQSNDEPPAGPGGSA